MSKGEKDLLFETLLAKYQNLVYKICLDMTGSKEDAENLLQDSFLDLYKSLDRYITLEENEIKNILCKIALNNCRDYLKKYMYKMQMCSIEDMETDIKEEENITEKIIKKEEKNAIRKAIQALDSPYKEVLEMHFLEEKSLDVIAKELNIAKATLKMQIYRAKQKLKKKIKEEFYGQN